MDALEERVLEALARAAVAEKIAERALALAQDCLVKVEILRALPVNSYSAPPVLDPFAEPEKEPTAGDNPVRLSPFTTNFAGRVTQTTKEANANLETPLTDDNQIWDKGVET